MKEEANWDKMKGGYRLPHDPRSAIAKLQHDPPNQDTAVLKATLMPSKIFTPLLCLAFLLAWSGGYATEPLWTPETIIGMDYPEAANQAGIQGQVKVIVRVNVAGSVTSVKGEGNPNPILFDAVQKDVSGWTFNGQGSNDWRDFAAFLNFSFRLDEPCSENPKSQFGFTYPDRVFISSRYKCHKLSKELQGDQKEPLTVCQILQNLRLYDGNLIQVRGEWHGSYIEDKCQMPLQTEDHKWPDEITVEGPFNLHGNDETVNWSFTPDDYIASFSELLRFKGPVYATIVGRLDARAQLIHYPNGSTNPGGYGHLGYYPARIVVKQIKDIVGSGLRDPNEKIEIMPPIDD